MSESWRYVDCVDGDALENNAQMAVLARSATDDVHQPDASTGITTDDLHTAFRKSVDDAKEAST